MRRAGFSLPELIITVTVVGILATLTVPATVTWRKRQSVTLAAGEFKTALGLSRATAVRTGRLTEFHIDPANARFWIEVDAGPLTGRDEVGAIRDVAGGQLTMSSNRTLLCFDGRGLPTVRQTSQGVSCQAADAVVIFARGGLTKKLVLTPLGRVQR
jgi:prepilin-type N-terminal cleavage/methylation domain-containing protein